MLKTGMFTLSGPGEEWALAVTPEAPQAPEPESLVLLGTGAASFGTWLRRRSA